MQAYVIWGVEGTNKDILLRPCMVSVSVLAYALYLYYASLT